MKNINVHIYPSNMTNESRIFKESKFISKNCDFEKIILLGIWEGGLNKDELYENNIYIKRVSLLNIKKRSILYLYYFMRMIVFIVLHRPKMINIHTLELLPLTVIAKILKIKIIYDAHELETEKENLKGFRKKISKMIERVFIGFVDKVIVVGESIADEYKKMYPKVDRPFVVLNTPNYTVTQKNDLFRGKFNIDKEKIVFLYQGALSKGRGVDLLLESFVKRKDDEVVIVFMGFGRLEEDIKTASKENNNIFFHSAVAPDIVLDYTSSADFGMHMIKNTCLNHYYCLPNKLFEYANAGLPVVVSNMKEMKELVEKYDMGVVVKDNKIESINNAIDKILDLDIERMKQNSRRCAEENSWNVQEKILKKVYQGMV